MLQRVNRADLIKSEEFTEETCASAAAHPDGLQASSHVSMDSSRRQRELVKISTFLSELEERRLPSIALT
jgi:hypothetical protein